MQVKGKLLDPAARSLKLSKLLPNTKYKVCVLGLGNWITRLEESNSVETTTAFNASRDDAVESIGELVDSPTSRCTEMRTLEAPSAAISSGGSSMDNVSEVSTMLTRRLGLIVGSCMGFVVFVFLVSVLGYLKVKKQRDNTKREQQAIPPEYISYRHFSIQSGEAGHAAKTATQEHQNFITNVNNVNNANTTLNV